MLLPKIDTESMNLITANDLPGKLVHESTEQPLLYLLESIAISQIDILLAIKTMIVELFAVDLTPI